MIPTGIGWRHHEAVTSSRTFGEGMKLLPPVLFSLGYFLGGWVAIWLLVIALEREDPKFAGDVGFYYGLWICAYLPIAIMGAIALTRMAGGFRRRLLAAVVCLLAVLAVMFSSYYLDAHWPFLLVEYIGFGVGFWLLVKRTNNTEQAGGGNALPRAPHP